MTKLKNPTDSGKSLAAGFQNKLSANNSTKAHTMKPGTKAFGVLFALVQGYSFNRFQAERELNDHCLPSTVSALQGKGISIHREMEKIPCLGGAATTEVARYRLLPSEIAKAKMLLGQENTEVKS